MSAPTPKLGLLKVEDVDDANDAVRVFHNADVTILDEAVLLTAAQTLVNKTLASPLITGTFGFTGALNGTLITWTNTDPGNIGIRLAVMHDSASPAALDFPFILQANGRSSTGVQRTYGQLYHQVVSPTNAAEASQWVLMTMQAGSLGNALVITGGAAGASNAITAGGLTVTGGINIATAGLTVSGGAQASMTGRIQFTGNVAGAVGSLYKDAAGGLVMWGVTGSSYDFTLLNNGGSGVFSVPTGTQQAVFSGRIGMGSSTKPWDVNTVIDFANGTAALRQSGTSIVVAQNAYYNGSVWKQSILGAATLYVQSGGVHSWYTDPAVAPGPDQTYVPTIRMTLSATGVLTGYAVPSARVYNGSAIGVSSAATSYLTFDSERWDTDAIHDTSVNASRLTCKTAGQYLIFAAVRWASNVTGTVREIAIRLNGVTFLAAQDYPVGGNVVYGAISTVFQLAVNDYVEVGFYHDATGALNVIAGAAYSPEFGMTRIG